MKTKQIIVCGGGFAGVNCALNLAKQLPDRNQVRVTLIDKQPYHLIHSQLYEVATSPEDLSSLVELKRSLAIPMTEIFSGTGVEFKMAEIKDVDPKARQIRLDREVLNYDYAVLALGSVSNYYGIPGAQENALPLKDARHALQIRNRIEFLMQAHRQDPKKQHLRIAVAGGGFAGVELAGELKGFVDFLAWKNGYPREKVEIMIIEGSPALLPGLDIRVGQTVANRLTDLGVIAKTDVLITKVDEQFLEFNNGERIEYDCLIWTAGVQATTIPIAGGTQQDRGQRIVTNGYLQMESHQDVFVVGDQTCFMDPEHRPLPGTARQAIHQSRYVAKALLRLIQNQTPDPYACRQFGYIIPVGGKWAVFKSSRIFLTGKIPYFMRWFGWLRYYYEILGLRRALQLSFLEDKLYFKNDP